MSAYILVKYLHFVSILSMISLLVLELALVEKQMTRASIRKLARLDGFYGLAAILVVAAGLILWFGVGKGDPFYDNPILYIKVALAILVGLISIVPTVYFIRHAKGDPDEVLVLPPRIRQLIILQLAVLAVIPLLATLMAQGIRI